MHQHGENQNFNFRDLINIEEWESSLKETHVIWVREHIISTVENPLPFEGENNFYLMFHQCQMYLKYCLMLIS